MVIPSCLFESLAAITFNDLPLNFDDKPQKKTSVKDKEHEVEILESKSDVNMNIVAIVLSCFVLFLLVIAAVALLVKWFRNKRDTAPENTLITSPSHSPKLTKGNAQPPLMHIDSLDDDSCPVKHSSPVTSDSDCEIDNILTSGKLEFAFNYDDENNDLKVHLLRAIGLPRKKGANIGRYVEVYLLPFRTIKGKTKIKHNTNNPIFNEQFVFEDIPQEDLSNRTLQFCVLEFDSFSRQNLIGEVLYTFEQNSKNHEGAVLVRDIKRQLLQEKPMEPCGAILLSMCYLPTASRLTFVVLKAIILNVSEKNGINTPDLYVKTTLRQNGERIRTTKTAVARNTKNPVYNEAFVFDLPTNIMNDVGIVVRLIDNRNVTKRTIGHVTLGPNALTSMGIHHWNCMMTSPRKPIAQWHSLMT